MSNTKHFLKTFNAIQDLPLPVEINRLVMSYVLDKEDDKRKNEIETRGNNSSY